MAALLDKIDAKCNVKRLRSVIYTGMRLGVGGRECLPPAPTLPLLVLICLQYIPPCPHGIFVVFLVDAAKIVASTSSDKTPL